MYQVLEIFETKYIFVVYFFRFFLSFSDLFLMFVCFSLLFYTVLLNVLSTEYLYSVDVVSYLNNLVKDLTSDLSKQQIFNDRNTVSLIFFCIFNFILSNNLISLIPMTYAITSQLSVTLFLSFTLCFGISIIGCLNMSFGYLYLFISAADEMPLLIVPFLIMIEIMSYIARYFSLGLRLFANMMAGHSLMGILGKFYFSFYDFYSNYDLLIIICNILLTAIVCLEMGVSFLQSYVYLLLSYIYLGETFTTHKKKINNFENFIKYNFRRYFSYAFYKRFMKEFLKRKRITNDVKYSYVRRFYELKHDFLNNLKRQGLI